MPGYFFKVIDLALWQTISGNCDEKKAPNQHFWSFLRKRITLLKALNFSLPIALVLFHFNFSMCFWKFSFFPNMQNIICMLFLINMIKKCKYTEKRVYIVLKWESNLNWNKLREAKSYSKLYDGVHYVCMKVNHCIAFKSKWRIKQNNKNNIKMLPTKHIFVDKLG